MHKKRLLPYIQKTVDRCLEILFPKPEIVQRFEAMSIETILEHQKIQHITSNVTSVFPYRETMIQEVIKDWKYHKNRVVAQKFGLCVAKWIVRNDLDTPHTVLIPIPASKARLKQYGFNQCSLLATYIQEHCVQIRVDEKLLVRVGRHVSQTKQSRTQRTQLNNVFTCRVHHAYTAEQLRTLHFIIIDDIYTTGATSLDATRALQAHGAVHISTLAVAH
jgi:ComF family protein